MMKKMRALLVAAAMTVCLFSLTACSEVKEDLEDDIDTLTDEAEQEEKEGKSQSEAVNDVQGDIDKDAEGLLDDIEGGKDK